MIVNYNSSVILKRKLASVRLYTQIMIVEHYLDLGTKLFVDQLASEANLNPILY